MLRYAGYAAAVLFAVLAVGFVALWVRSYGVVDVLGGQVGDGQHLHFFSSIGVLNMNAIQSDKLPAAGWSKSSVIISSASFESRLKQGFLGLTLKMSKGQVNIGVPYWFLVASSLALAALFALKRTWRFSLRTILFATTLLAGLLGLAVWAV